MPSQMAHLRQEDINTELKHYSGPVFAGDVVNEALEENGNGKDSPAYQAMVKEIGSQRRPDSLRARA
jgi:GH35 family endo-1,4-beta-xylanase